MRNCPNIPHGNNIIMPFARNGTLFGRNEFRKEKNGFRKEFFVF